MTKKDFTKKKRYDAEWLTPSKMAK